MLFLLYIIVLVEVVYSLIYGDTNNRHNRRSDYNYNDWEETTQDYYALLISTSNRTTASTPSSSSPHILPSTTEVTSPLATTPSSNETFLSSPSISASSLTAETTLTSAIELTTTDSTSDVFDVTTDKIFQNFTIQSTIRLAVDNYIIYEIRKIKKEKREGDFTASLILLHQYAIAKDPGQLTILLRGLNEQLMRIDSHQQLMLFGPTVVDKITSMALMAANADVQQIRAQLEYIMYCLHNRRGSVYREVNAVIDVADNIFIEDDVRNVADALRDFRNFPSKDKTQHDVAKGLLEAFIYKPCKRIEGTTKERLFLMELDYAVDRLLSAQGAGGMRRRFGETKPPETTAPTKSIMDLIIESNYVKNKKIMKNVKHRMMKYKQKRRKDKKKNVSRGITTTTVLTTTTKKVKMRKSKYYIRKYVKKDLRRRTLTTEKSTTTRDMFKYYGNIRKRVTVGDVEGRRYMRNQRGSEEDSDGDYYSGEEDVYDDDVTSVTEQTETYSAERYKKQLTNTLAYHFGRRNAESPDVNYIDKESRLKLSLRDALIHSEHENIEYRRVLKEKLNERRESFSDDELVLKKNIYNAFGYKDKFNLA